MTRNNLTRILRRIATCSLMIVGLLGVVALIGGHNLALRPAAALGLNYCPIPRGVVTPISWISGAKPTCRSDFIRNLDSESRHPSCKQLIRKIVAFAGRNVRRLHCDNIDGNVLFLSKNVFITVNHMFTDGNAVVQNRFMLDTCYVLGNSNTTIVEDHVDVDSIKLGDRIGNNDTAGDFAVASVKQPLDDIETEPVEIVPYRDVVAGKQEFFLTSAYNPYPATKACFSVTKCLNRGPNYTADGEASSMFVSDCPGIEGLSGSPAFTLTKTDDGKCTSMGLVGIIRGGVFSEVEDRPFKYVESHPNDHDVGNNYTLVVGVDNAFRKSLDALVQKKGR